MRGPLPELVLLEVLLACAAGWVLGCLCTKGAQAQPSANVVDKGGCNLHLIGILERDCIAHQEKQTDRDLQGI